MNIILIFYVITLLTHTFHTQSLRAMDEQTMIIHSDEECKDEHFERLKKKKEQFNRLGKTFITHPNGYQTTRQDSTTDVCWHQSEEEILATELDVLSISPPKHTKTGRKKKESILNSPDKNSPHTGRRARSSSYSGGYIRLNNDDPRIILSNRLTDHSLHAALKEQSLRKAVILEIIKENNDKITQQIQKAHQIITEHFFNNSTTQSLGEDLPYVRTKIETIFNTLKEPGKSRAKLEIERTQQKIANHIKELEHITHNDDYYNPLINVQNALGTLFEMLRSEKDIVIMHNAKIAQEIIKNREKIIQDICGQILNQIDLAINLIQDLYKNNHCCQHSSGSR